MLLAAAALDEVHQQAPVGIAGLHHAAHVSASHQLCMGARAQAARVAMTTVAVEGEDWSYLPVIAHRRNRRLEPRHRRLPVARLDWLAVAKVNLDQLLAGRYARHYLFGPAVDHRSTVGIR